MDKDSVLLAVALTIGAFAFGYVCAHVISLSAETSARKAASTLRADAQHEQGATANPRPWRTVGDDDRAVPRVRANGPKPLERRRADAGADSTILHV